MPKTREREPQVDLRAARGETFAIIGVREQIAAVFAAADVPCDQLLAYVDGVLNRLA